VSQAVTSSIISSQPNVLPAVVSVPAIVPTNSSPVIANSSEAGAPEIVEEELTRRTRSRAAKPKAAAPKRAIRARAAKGYQAETASILAQEEIELVAALIVSDNPECHGANSKPAEQIVEIKLDTLEPAVSVEVDKTIRAADAQMKQDSQPCEEAEPVLPKRATRGKVAAVEKNEKSINGQKLAAKGKRKLRTRKAGFDQMDEVQEEEPTRAQLEQIEKQMQEQTKKAELIAQEKLLEAKLAEESRLAANQAARDKAEIERLEKEHFAKEQEQAERAKTLERACTLERERLAEEQRDQAQLELRLAEEKEKAEAEERILKQQIEQKRVEADERQREEAELKLQEAHRLHEEAERIRIQEQSERRRELLSEQERLEQEMLKREKLEKVRAMQDKLSRHRAEQEKAGRDREKKRLENDRLKKEMLEKKLDQEKVDRERADRERLESGEQERLLRIRTMPDIIVTVPKVDSTIFSGTVISPPQNTTPSALSKRMIQSITERLGAPVGTTNSPIGPPPLLSSLLLSPLECSQPPLPPLMPSPLRSQKPFVAIDHKASGIVKGLTQQFEQAAADSRKDKMVTNRYNI
jgi:hypothetical protein